ncbi:uncharacterized protein FIBRA_07085 [Fibroporia radiculosa]|uniref:Mid2 domain-containing protein n=1 Tax=Fibroporia radiculosa TaxID=599839 RepID=J4H4F2_9APHY|nr:uncharacterized protein FIBRA_07085 [Fibroporia radiculosa]CCM04889.1 predicted protein [Fibroporia radiculosa]
MLLPLHFPLALLLPAFASAFSFEFTNTPEQCQNLSLSITGSGTPPYSVLVIPFGPSPLANNIEVRKIFSVQFSGTSHSFQLNYPGDSQFVAVVSDSTGFGTGGTSIAATVLSSSDSSCYNDTEVSPDWDFSIFPANQIVECSAMRIDWNPAVVEGTPTFQGVIPGGQSFAIPQGTLTNVTGEGLGFSWTPSVRIGTTVILVGGDNRGQGTGGSGLYIVSQGSSQSCLNANSPSSTPGSPAGGSYPTSTSGAGTGGGSTSDGHSTDVGAIVGGVIGGVIGVILILAALFFLLRRRRSQKEPKEQPVDLLLDHDHDDGQLPQYYEPQPFVMPEPTVRSSTGGDMESQANPQLTYESTSSHYGAEGGLRAGTPDYTARSGSSGYLRKSPAVMRPVNIVQHEDAGPEEAGQEPETIELPPAYTNLRGKSTPQPSPPESSSLSAEAS